MKRKYAYIAIIVVLLVVLYFVNKRFLSYKKNVKADNLPLKENIVFDSKFNEVQEENKSIDFEIENTILEKTKLIDGPIKENIQKKENFLSDILTKDPKIMNEENADFSFTEDGIIEKNTFIEKPENKNLNKDSESFKDLIVEINPIIEEKKELSIDDDLDISNDTEKENIEISTSKKEDLIFDFYPKKFFLYETLQDKKIEKVLSKQNDLSSNISVNDDYKNEMMICFSQRKLKEIIITNNKYTKSELLKKRIKINPGEYLNEKKLQKHLNFLNLNPFRKIEALIEPKEDDLCNLELLCFDRFSFRPYVGTDNTGLKIVDRNRIYAGFNWNNAFTLDSILSYQYLASYNFKKFQAHTGNWTVFLPCEDILTFFGSYAHIEVDHMIPYIIKHQGFALQTSFRYDIRLPLLDNLINVFILGCDFKRTDTNLIFSRFSAIDDTPVNLFQFLLSYALSWNNNVYNTKLLLEMFFSPGEWLPDQENTRYNNLRRYAKNQYIYAKGNLSNLIKMPKDFLFSLIITGQVSNENLLPSETFAIGGYNSVRGYYEREVNTDSGIIASAELRSPSLSLNLKNDSLRFIVFFDYGYGSIHQTMPFEEKNASLMGFGPGLRYFINTNLAARLDWGIKGNRKEEYGNANSLLHFSVNLSY